MSDDFEELPNDLEAEMAVLGAAMLLPEAAGQVVDALTSRHFYRPAHQAVFEAIATLVERSAPVDLVSVRDELHRRSENGEQVHPRILADLVESVIAAGHIGYHLALLQEHYLRRKLFWAGRQLRSLGARRDLDYEDVAEQARRVVDAVADVPDASTALPVSELIGPYLDRLESKAPELGVTTGWKDLDGLLTRCRPGQLIVVGARPGQGKSVLMVNIALHVGLRLRKPVFFASLEMSHDELLERMVAHEAGVPLGKLKRRDLDADDWTRVAKRQAELAEADHLIVDDDPGMSLSRLRARLATMRRSGQPAAIACVDYLQLMTSPAKRTESRQQEVSDISRELKLLAKEMGLPIVVGAQLNRGPELRTNKRPTKADLRESGSIEQDADVVILLHREDAYEPESPRAGEIDLIVDKHRQGPTATITAAFQGHYSRIADMAPRTPQWSPTKGLS